LNIEVFIRIVGIIFLIQGIIICLSNALYRGGIFTGFIKVDISPRLAYLTGTFFIIGGIIMIINYKAGIYIGGMLIGLGSAMAAIYGMKYE